MSAEVSQKPKAVNSKVGIVVLDKNSVVTFINKNASEYLKKPSRNLIGNQFPYTVLKGQKREITVRCNDCNILHLEMSREDFSESGNESTLVIIQEVSEFKNKIVALEESIDKLQSSYVYKDIIENISADIHRSLDVRTILNDSVSLIVSKVKRADSALISLIKDDFAVIKAHRGYPQWFIERIKKLPRGRGAIWKVLNDGQAIYQSNVNEDKHIGPAGRELGTKSYAAIPIFYNEKVLGVLTINSYSEDAFTEEEISLFEEIKKHLEIAIRNSRELNRIKTTKARFDSFMKNMPGAAFIKDKDLRHIYVNPGYEQSVQLEVEKVLNKTAEEVWPKEIAEEITRNDKYVFRNGEPSTVFEVIPMEGYISHWIVNKFPIYIDNVLTHLGGIAIDVTEQMKAKEKIQEQAELLNAAPNSIILIDTDYNIEFFNEKAKVLLNTSCYLDYKNIKINDLFQPKEDIEKILESVKVNGSWSGELTYKDEEGSSRTLQSNLKLVIPDNKDKKSILIVNMDITEKKKMELQLRQAQRMESIGTLAGGIAHDLNNMLMPISMAVYWLKEYKIKDEANHDKYLDLVNMVEEASVRASNLVKQILTFSREFEGNLSPVSINSVLDDLLEVINSTFPKSISIKTDISANMRSVLGNITQIYQVLMNLCVNARDAIGNEGTITVRADEVFIDRETANKMVDAYEGNYICLTISDDGEGITKNNLDKIFDPFFTTKEQGKGTGLGLSICYNIIKDHRGFIKVYSEVGYGTEFIIYIPVNERQDTAGDKISSIGDEIPKGKGETVLVVDDEESVRTISNISLSNNGYNVIDAEDGADGIAKYMENKDIVDVVIVDMMMPTLDGPSCIRTLKKINPSIKIIGSSGLREMYKKVIDSSDITLDGELNKPYSTETLLIELQKVLRPGLN